MSNHPAYKAGWQGIPEDTEALLSSQTEEGSKSSAASDKTKNSVSDCHPDSHPDPHQRHLGHPANTEDPPSN